MFLHHCMKYSSALAVVFTVGFSSIGYPYSDEENVSPPTNLKKRRNKATEVNSKKLKTGSTGGNPDKEETQQSDDNQTLFSQGQEFCSPVIISTFFPASPFVPSTHPYQNHQRELVERDTLPTDPFALYPLFAEQNCRNPLAHVFSFLSLSDLGTLATLSKPMHASVFSYFMATDSRNLQSKVWQQGPQGATLDNYRFNTTIHHAQRLMLRMYKAKEYAYSCKKQEVINKYKQIILPPLTASLSRTITFLAEEFKLFEATSPIVGLLRAVTEYFNNPRKKIVDVPKSFRKLCTKADSNRPERELYNLTQFLAQKGFDPTMSTYYDRPEKEAEMGVLERYLQTSQIRTMISSQSLSFEHSCKNYDFLIRWGVDLTSEDYKHAARAHFRTKNYSRLADLYEEAFKRDPNQPASVYLEAAIPQSKAENYSRSADLYEEAFKRDPNQPAFVYWNAALAHLKAQNYSRSAELWEEVRKRDPLV